MKSLLYWGFNPDVIADDFSSGGDDEKIGVIIIFGSIKFS